MDNSSEAEVLVEFGASTAHGGFVFTASKAISALVTLILLIFLARYLKPADFGIYGIAVSFSLLLHAGGSFGMATAMRRRLPQLKSKGEIFSMMSNAYALSLIVTIVVVAFGVGISGILARYAYGNESLALPLALGAIMVFFSVVYNLSISALIGIGKVASSSYSVIVYSIAQLVFVLALVLAGYGIVGALLGSIAGLFIGLVLGISYMVKYIGFKFVKPSKKEMKDLGRFTFPLVVSGISVNGSKSLAVMVLGLFVSTFIVGEYNAAFKLGNFAEVIITSLSFILLPAFSKAIASVRLSDKISSIFNSSIYYTLLLMLPIVAYLGTVSKPLIYLLYSHAYANTPFYFIFIVVGITLSIIGTYGSNIIIGYGDTKRTTKYQVAVVLVEVALLGAMTPFMKAYGVLLSIYLIGPIIFDVIYIHALEKSFGIRLRYKQLAVLIAANMILFAILLIPSMLIKGLKIILVNAALCIAVYPILVAMLHVVSRKNLEFIENVGKRLRMQFITKPLVSYTMLFLRQEAKGKDF